MDLTTVGLLVMLLRLLTNVYQGIPTIEETELPEVPPTTFLEKVAAILF